MKLPNAATWCGRRFFAVFAATHAIDASPASPMRTPVSRPFLICSPAARSRSPQSTPIAPPGMKSFVGNAASPSRRSLPDATRCSARILSDPTTCVQCIRRIDPIRPTQCGGLRQGMRRLQSGWDTDERRGPHRAAIAVPGERAEHPVCPSAGPAYRTLPRRTRFTMASRMTAPRQRNEQPAEAEVVLVYRAGADKGRNQPSSQHRTDDTGGTQRAAPRGPGPAQRTIRLAYRSDTMGACSSCACCGTR